MFVVVFPLAPLGAMLAALIACKLNPQEILRLSRRPMPQGAQSIGAWYWVFDAMSFVSLVSNLAIVVFTNQGPVFNQNWDQVTRLIVRDVHTQGVLRH
jgi:hypothetical protein